VKIRQLVIGAVFAFLAVAFLFPIVPQALFISLLISLPSLDDLRYDDDLLKRLRAVSSKGGLIRGEDVTAGLVDALPVGISEDNATRYLKANGFECGVQMVSIAEGQLAGKRQAGRFPCGETWVVRLTWTPDRTIADRRATLDVVCL
jgi:hypothetical protein